jgi:hypothetical protein
MVRVRKKIKSEHLPPASQVPSSRKESLKRWRFEKAQGDESPRPYKTEYRV